MKLWELEEKLKRAREQGAEDNTEVVMDLTDSYRTINRVTVSFTSAWPQSKRVINISN